VDHDQVIPLKKAYWDEGKYKHSALTEQIIAGFYDTYNELGYGFLESVYEEALFRDLGARNLRVERQLAVRSGFGERRSVIFTQIWS
jgi:hypothetical protein